MFAKHDRFTTSELWDYIALNEVGSHELPV